MEILTEYQIMILQLIKIGIFGVGFIGGILLANVFTKQVGI